MQIPTFTTSQRPLIPPSLSGIITYTRFKPFFQSKHFPIPFHSLTQQTSVVKAITINNHEAVVAENNNISNDDNNEPKFIDIGYVSGVHGFQGDVRVKPNTDFPELRFSTV
ncbi:ribosome maturation factor rimM [Trifolium pratense]|uniref:Ribosome maturation factor rimM n=1 Tax=Trifolium pratense TaxID=57577 RepID=A0A2K3JTA4_TRIPR|nr:ribosome maturation factor rimM [Trifolium pratense]